MDGSRHRAVGGVPGRAGLAEQRPGAGPGAGRRRAARLALAGGVQPDVQDRAGRPGGPPELLAGGITSLRVFAGYAGWGPGQLQAEIEEGAWYVLAGEPTDAFLAEPERLWQEVLRRQGGEFAIVATYPDDPLLN